jgi:predicted aspartyl protease
MRIVTTIALLAALLPAAAYAQDKCAAPQAVTTVQMTRATNGSDLIPVRINGVEKQFLFDSGGGITQISRNTAQELNLTLHPGSVRVFDLAGNVSRDQTLVDSFAFGRLAQKDVPLPVAPPMPFEGIFAPDRLLDYDVDVDFGADTLNLFAPDRCPGGAPARKAMAMAPIALEGTHIVVPVTLDGQAMDAILDTGASTTTLQVEYAQRLFMFPLGDAATPENGVLNGAASLKTYRHLFQSMAFGAITIHNLRVTLIPDAMGRGGDPSRTQSALTAAAPKMIIGMDVLRQLHVIMAFKDNKIYIGPASRAAQPQSLANVIAALSAQIAAAPDNAELWNARCFMRGVGKSDLDAAIADCDQALKLKPGTIAYLDSRAMVLYLQGKYGAALEAYNAILLRDAKFAPSLLMRGYAKGMLGDQPGKAADIAAARASQADIQARFQGMGLIN